MVSTPEYVDLLMSWIEAQINDENIFPPDVGRRPAFMLMHECLIDFVHRPTVPKGL